jgi:putative endonuclease
MNDKSGYLENLALRWLKARGLKVVAKNYLSRAGEIDIIMLDGDTLCFIDVEYRVGRDFDSTDYSIPEFKQQNILQAASSFVNHQNKYLKYSRRFDALFVEPCLDKPFKMNWIKAVFSADPDYGK